MSLINPSYFIGGELHLPQASNNEGQIDIQNLIDKHEQLFLKETLGYDLWKAFILGLQESTVDQKWLDLLNGKEYSYGSTSRFWIGFVPLLEGGVIDITAGNVFYLVVGRGEQYDPINNVSTFIIPPAFRNIPISVEMRVTGTLHPDEYSISDDGITFFLETGDVFHDGGRIVLRKGAAITQSTSDVLKISPIANYIYCKYLDKQATEKTLVGVTVPDTDNATRENGAETIVRAWNEMVDYLSELRIFLNLNRETYPEWKGSVSKVYKKKNVFSI